MARPSRSRRHGSDGHGSDGHGSDGHGSDGHGSHARAGLQHVFVIVLENYKAEDVTPTAAPYLTRLAQQGVTLDAMYGVDHASLSNYIAMTSGNAPNAKTQADCFQYDCIFEPPTDRNLADQLEARHRDWKAYMESMPAPCAHPTSSGPLDPYLVGYATRHNPFVYYRDIVGPDISKVSARCAAHDVPYTQLAPDLAAGHVPAYALIVPDTCNDGHDRGPNCSLPTADAWLATNVPTILAIARVPESRRAHRHVRRVRGLRPARLLRQLVGRQDRHGGGLALRDPTRIALRDAVQPLLGPPDDRGRVRPPVPRARLRPVDHALRARRVVDPGPPPPPLTLRNRR